MFKLSQTVGPEYQDNPDDVLLLKSVLNQLGYYKTPSYGITPYADNVLFSAVKSFQKENKLKQDGTVKPGGKTHQALTKAFSSSWESDEEWSEDPDVRSPTMWCTNCGGPHGGAFGDLCQWCALT